MSDTLATYSFLPWLRTGISNSITQGDNDPAVLLRASIPVSLSGTAINTDDSEIGVSIPEQTVNLYGPGDIIGIDSKAIVKTEPRNWITNFEPNYLPFIEFYNEDFAWRYTPAKPSGDKLRPWLTLVVLKEDEFEEGANLLEKPLPFLKIRDGKKAGDIFPDPSQLWAWAHVHVNTDLSKGAGPNAADPIKVTDEIINIINNNPDQAYSRIICPRKLETNTAYFAFLIATFESGRLSGLGLELPADLVATQCGWETGTNTEFPYYYRWYFRTGNIGDFEYLVNLLKPKPADKTIGVRDMDVVHIGSNIPPIDTPSDLNGILKLGGALRVPFETLNPADKTEVTKYDEWDEQPYPHPFVRALATRINLTDDYSDPAKEVANVNGNANIKLDDNSNDPDPVITSPLYGRWHALTERLLTERNGINKPNFKNWIHELNLDPRYRVSAGFGTKVVQKNQEEFIQSAWEQVGKIVEANNKIRMAQLARETTHRFYTRHVLPLTTEKAFIFTASVHKRIVHQDYSVHKQVKESIVPLAVTSGTFRSITRPRGKTMKKLIFTDKIKPGSLIERINSGEIKVVPPKSDPAGGINLSGGEAALQPQNVPPFILRFLIKFPWLKYLPLVLILLFLIVVLLFFKGITSYSVLSAIAAGLVLLYRKFVAWYKAIAIGQSIRQVNQEPGAVDKLPRSPDFRISIPGSNFQPSYGTTDIAEAYKFKQSLKDAYTILNVSFPEPIRAKLDLKVITDKVLASINPSITIPKRTMETITIPGRILDNMVEKFTTVQVYPEIDIPMYKPLAEISSELFLPNINRIEQNSLTLLENNQKFIEAYMVGINHEMSRELLWREYPSDQRGTYFRQFWDVSGYLPPQPVPADIKEKLRDIPPIHKWPLQPLPGNPKRNNLGENNQRSLNGDKAQLVLVVRGELLKKYPTAVIYAQKASWGKNSSNNMDVNEERVFVELSESEKLDPPRTLLKTPLFEAKVEPDIYFFGFDLTALEAKGTPDPKSISDNPGWFFVIKERPGEPRFGLDLNKADRIINWNNLSWEDVGTEDGSCIELGNNIPFVDYNSVVDQENKPTTEDDQAKWGLGSSSAELAYILYQVPVLVGVHASRMLASS